MPTVQVGTKVVFLKDGQADYESQVVDIGIRMLSKAGERYTWVRVEDDSGCFSEYIADWLLTQWCNGSVEFR